MKSRTFIFVTNNYMPRPGGTGICVHFVARELLKRGYTIYVISYDDEKGKERFIYEGINVIKVKTPFFLKGRSAASRARRFFAYTCSLIAKLLYIHKYPLRSYGLVRSYKKELINILNDNPYSTVVSTFTPIEAEVAVIAVKGLYHNIKTVFYSTDTLSNELSNAGVMSSNMRKRYGLRWEKKIFELYDLLLIMECHKNHYMQPLFNDYFDKMKVVNFPLLNKFEKSISNTIEKDDGKCLIVYTGALYRQLRNPSYTCDLLKELNEETDIEVRFLGGGDCGEIISKYDNLTKGHIKHLGLQSHDIAAEYISNADVLLSIGNKESPMMPSKIYEYMSTGKPIIHIYSWDKDPCLAPLERYNNALLIKETGDYSMQNIVSFIKNRRVLDYSIIAELFKTSTPSYTADIIENL